MNRWERYYRPNREHLIKTLQRMFDQQGSLTRAIADNFNKDVRRN